MADKERLGDMLDAIINNKPEEAQIAFHDYLGNKMKQELQGNQEFDLDNDED